MSKLFWSDWPRIVGFWAIVVLAMVASDRFIDALDLGRVASVVTVAVANAGSIEGNEALASISRPDFALSLAFGLACFGGALLAAFLVMHWLLIRLSLWMLRRQISHPRDRKSFADTYDNTIYPRLIRHALLGHAWKEFDETLLKGSRTIDGIIGNTVRPQAFINYGVLRERLSGLRG